MGREPHTNDQALQCASTLATTNMAKCGDYRAGGQGPRVRLLIMQEEAYVPERGYTSQGCEEWKDSWGLSAGAICGQGGVLRFLIDKFRSTNVQSKPFKRGACGSQGFEMQSGK